MTHGRRVISVAAWSAAIKIGFQLLTWAMTLLVIRILSPSDYGLMAISMTFVNALSSFANLGLGDALVQRQDTPKQMIANVFGLNIVIATCLTMALSLAAYAIAAWYHDMRLIPLLQVASLGFLFDAFCIVPRVFLTKRLQLRSMFLMEVSSGLMGGGAVIILAYSGQGVWALMGGWVVGSLAHLLFLGLLMPEYYVWPKLDLRVLRPLYSYSLYRTLDNVAWVVLTSADVLILGWWFNPAEVGLYTVALNFACMPLNKIAPIVNSVAFPAFAMVQERPAEARFYAMKALRLMSLVAVPVFFGLSAVAPEVVDVVFGPKWAAAKPLLAVLALAMTWRAVLLVIPNYLRGIGDARAGFWCTATGAIVLPPVFIVGCHWGLVGCCCSFLFGYPVIFIVNVLIAARRGRLDFTSLLLVPARPFVAGSAMALLVVAVRSRLDPGHFEFGQTVMLVATGVAAYIGIMAVMFPTQLKEFAGIVPDRLLTKVRRKHRSPV